MVLGIRHNLTITFGTVSMTYSQESIVQAVFYIDTDTALIQHRTATTACREQLIFYRIINYAVLSHAFVLNCNRNTEMRKTVDKVKCAIQRINHPTPVSVMTFTFLIAKFFTKETVIFIAFT